MRMSEEGEKGIVKQSGKTHTGNETWGRGMWQSKSTERTLVLGQPLSVLQSPLYFFYSGEKPHMSLASKASQAE